MARAKWPWRKRKPHPERVIDGRLTALMKRARPLTLPLKPPCILP